MKRFFPNMFNAFGYGDDNSEPSPSKSRRKDSSETDSNNINNDSCQITIDNSDNILKVLKKLYVEKEMCDIYLKVGKKEYGAHRIILCASSDVFQVMLMKPDWSEWQESRIELQEMAMCENVFHLFLEYFYTGKILITHTNVVPILALADKYILRSLTAICITYMSRHVPHAASHNQLFSWLQYSTYSTSCLQSDVFETCQNYIKWNFESVANIPDFSNFDVDMFIMILQQNDIVIHNEMVLYNCVVRWLELQKIKMMQIYQSNAEVEKEYKLLVEKIMKYIRFPMMTPRELAHLLCSPLIKQYKEFFVDRMAIGMNYHNGHTDQLQFYYKNEVEKLLFTPRLYTSDTYSASLTIDNFWNVPIFHSSTFVFSSHLSAAEHESNKINEWLVDLFPKGVWFKRCYLIVWQGTLEVPQSILSTVRLSLTCREQSESPMRVKISVLIYGLQGGVEHVMEVKERIHHFTEYDNVMNIDDLLPFHELNPLRGKSSTPDTPYLVGSNRNQLKLNLVIAPIR